MSDDTSLLDKIYNKVEKIDDKVSTIDATLGKQQVILDDHIRRTEILETRTDMIFDELKPLKHRNSMVDGAIKVMAGAVTLTSIILGLLKAFNKI